MDTAASPDQVIIDRLRERFPGWRVWRSRWDDGRPAAWWASNMDPDSDRVPTLTAWELGELERWLGSPPRRVRTAVAEVVAA